MKTPTKTKTDLLHALMDQFRLHGYDSLSLSLISEATGLGKASLYHHFPGGKEQMALEVMEVAKSWVSDEILTVLVSNEDPKRRLKLALGRLDAFYEHGTKACILEAMSALNAPVAVKGTAKDLLEGLMEGFRKVAKDMNKSPAQARAIAESAVVGLQGSLIVSRATHDKTIFKRFLSKLESEFLD